MRDDSSQEEDSSSSSLSWAALKEQGKTAFEQGDYSKAIKKYCLALQPGRNCPATERQIILSNMVAARLQLGGPSQAEAAVENAKQCVALNDRWAKGHVRLASAYIALGGHSNDACNALQRALQLDPMYPNARQMLIRELRRGHSTASSSHGARSGSFTGSSNTSSHGNETTQGSSIPTTASSAHETAERPQPSAPPQHFDDRDYTRQSSSNPQPEQGQQQASSSSPTTTTRNRPPENPYRDQPQPPPPLDEHFSIQERVCFYFNRVRMWYSSLSEDGRTLLKVLAVFVLLYVAFGGRFGLSKSHHRRGNYASGNAYDQYHQRQQPRPTNTARETGQGRNYQYSSSQHDRHHSSSYSDSGGRYDYTRHEDHDAYSYSQSRPARGSVSFQMPNLFDGSLPSMLLLAAVAYVCHRNGLNPMQVLFFLNLMNGGRRRHMFGYGGGMGGFGPRRW